MIHPTDVKLHGVRKEAMLAILDFAYTRTTEITNANVTEIISVAHYFGMAKLEDLCSGFIKSMLTPENSIFVWLELRFENSCDDSMYESLRSTFFFVYFIF